MSDIECNESWDIEGFQKLKIVEELICYDFELLVFICKDEKDNLYIINKFDEIKETKEDIYLMVPVSHNQLYDKETTMYNLYKTPENGFIYKVSQKNDIRIISEKVNPNSLTEDDLPDRGTYLYKYLE